MTGPHSDPHRDDRRDGHPDEPREQPVIRDRRRIDPTTGEVRATPGAGQPAPADPADPLARLEAELAAEGGGAVAGLEGLAAALDEARGEASERLDDLRRLQAEYLNYRRRVERDREVAGELALARALTELLPVLDDIDRARDHDDLTGGFKVVAETLEAAVGRLGLQRYGEVGDPFDPAIHDAFMHAHAEPEELPAGAGEDGEQAGPVCDRILLPGYRVGDRILRPARVSVLEPPG